MKKLSQQDFIESCKKIHNDKYDYSLVKYVNTRTKIIIICKEHGTFDQLSKAHLTGQGCPKCVGRLQTKEEFIEICNIKHNNKYDYSLSHTNINKRLNIRIREKSTGLIFNQIYTHHENGIRPTKIEKDSLIDKFKIIHNNKYSYIIDTNLVGGTSKIKLIDNITGDISLYRVDRHLLGMSPNKVTLNSFKSKSSILHNNKYDYSLINGIKGNKDIVSIICPDHGIFKQSINNHMNSGDKCPECAGFRRWTTDKLISKFNKVHFSKYDYSQTEYKGSSEKVKINCRDHGMFKQSIYHHLSGQGCKSCSSISIGEEYIKLYLEKAEIKYIPQHGFDTCRYINKLNFDFYLPYQNVCIEFDGIQHFKPIKDFGGEKGFIDGQKRDECKNKWCMTNNVKLIRIKYDQISEISEILDSELSSHMKETLIQ